MDGILRELDYFACIYGLKINFSKTKMVWIGSKKISKEVFHHSRWKLDWNNPTFDLLGVKFSVNLNEMVELNYPSKFLEVTRLIKQWKLRNLTTVGRLTVIKTLIIPKLNHLILTIPKPSVEYLQQFEKEIYIFLWGGKVHKVKKNIIIQDYRYGGLKMIDYMEFVCALKSTWIRRLIHSNTKWVKLFESELGLKIETLWEKGSDFITNISNKIRNKFWKEDY